MAEWFVGSLLVRERRCKGLYCFKGLVIKAFLEGKE